MRGTSNALTILGKSGVVEDKENLPEDYDVERSFKFSTLMEMAEGCETTDDLVQKIRKKQDELQKDFEEKKKQVDEQLGTFENGDKVQVKRGTGDIEEGYIRGRVIDRGHVFYKIYRDHELLGEYKDEVVESIDDFRENRDDDVEYVEVQFENEWVLYFTGVDGERYGDYEEGEIVELPKENAEIFVEDGEAVYVENKDSKTTSEGGSSG